MYRAFLLRLQINSLGLFDDRLKSLVGVTTAFLLPDEGADAFSVDLKAHKIRGALQVTSHELRVTSCELQATRCELRVASGDVRRKAGGGGESPQASSIL